MGEKDFDYFKKDNKKWIREIKKKNLILSFQRQNQGGFTEIVLGVALTCYML